MIVIDMEMPESCYDCEAFGSSFCSLWGKHKSFSDQRTKRHKDCPIVGEIKVNNDGMVIAADLSTVIDGTDEAPYKSAIVALDNAPTVLEETGEQDADSN